MDNRFGTWIKPAMADVDEDRLSKRWTAVETLLGELGHGEIWDLIVFCGQVGRFDEGTLTKVRKAFWTADNTFQMSGNDVELRLLAGAIVAIALGKTHEDQINHALAVACLSFGGMHTGFETTGISRRGYQNVEHTIICAPAKYAAG